MKKLLAILAFMAIASPVFAEELTNQSVTNQNSYLNVNVSKKPAQETGKQSIKNERSFLCINIVINGKALDDRTDNR